MLQFFLPMIPPTVTDQEHRIGKTPKGKVIVYDSPELKDARQKILSHVGRFAPELPLAGPVQLVVKWLFPCGEKHKDGERKITRPDTDNLQKMLKDCMTKVRFWNDDAQVCSEIIEKFWALHPGIFIQVVDLDEA